MDNIRSLSPALDLKILEEFDAIPALPQSPSPDRSYDRLYSSALYSPNMSSLIHEWAEGECTMGQHIGGWEYMGQPEVLDGVKYFFPMLTENLRPIDSSPFSAPTTSSPSSSEMSLTVNMADIHPPPPPQTDLSESDSDSAPTSDSDSASNIAIEPDFYFTPGHVQRIANLKTLYDPYTVSRPTPRSQIQSGTHPALGMTNSPTRLPGMTVVRSSERNVMARRQGTSPQMGRRQTSRMNRDVASESSRDTRGKRKRKKLEQSATTSREDAIAGPSSFRSTKKRPRKDSPLPEYTSEYEDSSDEDWNEGWTQRYRKQTKKGPGRRTSSARGTKNAEGKFVCELDGCTKGFTRANDRDRHQTTASEHSGERPYECLQCGKRYARSDQLNRHKTSRGLDHQ